jgi:hypothetical protein
MSENILKKKRVYVKKNKSDPTHVEKSDLVTSDIESAETHCSSSVPGKLENSLVPEKDPGSFLPRLENRLYPVVIPPIRITEQDSDKVLEINIKKKIDTPLCPKPTNVFESPQWPNIISQVHIIPELKLNPTEEPIEEPIKESTNYNDYLYYGLKLCSIISLASLAYIYFKKR